MLNRLINFLAFQVVWFLTLWGAGGQLAWLGALALSLFALWHFFITPSRRADLALVLFVAGLGTLVDTAFIQGHLLAYASPLPLAGVAPYWIVVVWMDFALTLNGSMGWLQGKYWLAAVLGALGGPISYGAGIKLGAATLLVSEPLGYGVLGLVWGLVLPFLVAVTGWANRRWPGLTNQ